MSFQFFGKFPFSPLTDLAPSYAEFFIMETIIMTSFNGFLTGSSILFCGEQISFQLQDARYEHFILSLFN